MANAALSNRERKQVRKVTPKPPRRARGDATVQVATEKAAPKEPDIKDGLEWLMRKGRLTKAQVYEGAVYRQGYRDAGEVSMLSCLSEHVGGGNAGGLPGVGVATMTQARRMLLVARYVVLRGQVDMLTVMDGVCGLGHTLRYLAGGDKHRAAELEVSLKIALDMLAAYRAGPPAVAKGV